MKVGAIIQARIDSTRLPRKVLMPLPFYESETIIGHLIQRLKKIKTIDQIIIATSSDEIDQELRNEAEKLDVGYYAGSKSNVLERIYQAALEREIDLIIRITGDNPFTLVNLIPNAVSSHIIGNYDYSRNRNLPTGTSFEIVNIDILKRIIDSSPTDIEKEHVTLHIKNNPTKFLINEINYELPVFPKSLRLTIDYASDYAMACILSQALSKTSFYTQNEISDVLRKYSWITAINSDNVQKRQINNVKDEVYEAIQLLRNADFHRAASLLDSINK